MFGIALLWTVLTFVVVSRTGSVIVDGFQSSGPVAGAAGPGALRWPMLGSFMGYDQSWGFHWFGWPWLRSLILPVLPWSPSKELLILSVLWAATACLLRQTVATRHGESAGWAAALLGLLAPPVWIALQSYRPEVPTALGVVALLATWHSKRRIPRLVNGLLLMILPLLHPLGLIVPVAFLAVSMIATWRTDGLGMALRQEIGKCLFFASGIFGFIAWYSLLPGTWEQFRLNLESQRLLVDGLGTGLGTFFIWALGSRSAIPLIALLIPALIEAVLVLTRAWKRQEDRNHEPVLLAAAGFLAALAFNILGRNPNVLHLVVVLPLAAWLLAIWLQRQAVLVHCAGFPIGIASLLLLFAAFPIKQSLLLIQHKGVSYRGELAALLKDLPASRRVLIPVAFWEAAAVSPDIYRFSTFPNILVRSQRDSYESAILNDLRSGDLLVWDSLQDDGGIFNFVTATALRHQIIRPPDDSVVWERVPELRLLTTYSKSQSAVFEVYRKR